MINRKFLTNTLAQIAGFLIIVAWGSLNLYVIILGKDVEPHPAQKYLDWAALLFALLIIVYVLGAGLLSSKSHAKTDPDTKHEGKTKLETAK